MRPEASFAFGAPNEHTDLREKPSLSERRSTRSICKFSTAVSLGDLLLLLMAALHRFVFLSGLVPPFGH
jgi:hypothetical protein